MEQASSCSWQHHAEVGLYFLVGTVTWVWGTILQGRGSAGAGAATRCTRCAPATWPEGRAGFCVGPVTDRAVQGARRNCARVSRIRRALTTLLQRGREATKGLARRAGLAQLFESLRVHMLEPQHYDRACSTAAGEDGIAPCCNAPVLPDMCTGLPSTPAAVSGSTAVHHRCSFQALRFAESGLMSWTI
jgi:hypothetical protein